MFFLWLVISIGGKIVLVVFVDVLFVFGYCLIFLNYGMIEIYCSVGFVLVFVSSYLELVGWVYLGVIIVVVCEDGSEVELGEFGEIVYCGIGVFFGYWGDF